MYIFKINCGTEVEVCFGALSYVVVLYRRSLREKAGIPLFFVYSAIIPFLRQVTFCLVLDS